MTMKSLHLNLKIAKKAAGFFHHLFGFSRARAEQDALYRHAFRDGRDLLIEAAHCPDKFIEAAAGSGGVTRQEGGGGPPAAPQPRPRRARREGVRGRLGTPPARRPG